MHSYYSWSFIKLFPTPLLSSSGARIHNNHTGMHFFFFSFSNQTETLTIPKAEYAKDEGTVQQGTDNPRGSWHTLMTTAFSK